MMGDNRTSSADSRGVGPRQALAADRPGVRDLLAGQPVRVLVRTAKILTIAFGLLVLVQVVLLKPYRIPSASMVPTFEPGDRVLAALHWYGLVDPGRGDIVVFHPNGLDDAVFRSRRASSRTFVKRIVGAAGRDGRLGRGPRLHLPARCQARRRDGTRAHAGLRVPGRAVHARADVPVLGRRGVRPRDGARRRVPAARRQPRRLGGLAVLRHRPARTDRRPGARAVLAVRADRRTLSPRLRAGWICTGSHRARDGRAPSPWSRSPCWSRSGARSGARCCWCSRRSGR